MMYHSIDRLPLPYGAIVYSCELCQRQVRRSNPIPRGRLQNERATASFLQISTSVRRVLIKLERKMAPCTVGIALPLT